MYDCVEDYTQDFRCNRQSACETRPLYSLGVFGCVCGLDRQRRPDRRSKLPLEPTYFYTLPTMDPEFLAQLGQEGGPLAAFFHQQQQLTQALQAQVTALQHQLQDQQANAQNMATAIVQHMPAPVVNLPPPTPPASRPPKAADPEVFTGDRKKADPFLRAISLNMAIQPNAFPNDRTRILYALSWMQGGSAGEWAANHTRSILEDNEQPFASWDAFRTRFEAAFGDTSVSHLRVPN